MLRALGILHLSVWLVFAVWAVTVFSRHIEFLAIFRPLLGQMVWIYLTFSCLQIVLGVLRLRLGRVFAGVASILMGGLLLVWASQSI